ncbi:MAG: hypothetical protein KatS3mg102_0239 [Planctomycetota bacterium]|nr:MAG: hypothetical protein KatS3mg102_0239 [Planctomycetota bacterium]
MRPRRTRWVLPAVTALSVAGLVVGCGSGKDRTTGGGSSSGSTTAQGQFHTVGQLVTGRKGHSATLIPSTGQVLVVGGLARAGGTDVAVETAELFDPASGRFVPVQARLSTARAYHAAAVSAIGNVLIAGGQQDAQGNQLLQTVEVYSAQTGRFSTASSLDFAVSEALAFTYPWQGAQRFLVAGGRATGQVARANGYRYTADAAPTRVGAASLLAARYGARTAPLDAQGNRVVVAGGLTTAVEVFHAATESFTVVGQLTGVRYGAALAPLGNGKVAIIGGRSGVATNAAAEATIAIYDDATGTIQLATRQLQTARSDATAVALPNGDILVVGGISSTGQVLASTEVISGNGIDLTVRQGPNLQVARRGHTATLLPNGAVLIAGGEDQSGTPLASAEVFALPGVNVPKPTLNPNAPIPQITAINPTQGPTGTHVTITASGISTNVNEIIVKFAGLLTPAQSAVQNGSSVNVTAVVPQNAVSGPVTVTDALSGQTSNGVQFTVTGSGGGGTGTGTPPRIWILLPSRAPAFVPVGIGGAHFSNPSTPWFIPVGSGNGVASVTLFNWSVQNIPLIGSVSVGFTIVPPALPVGFATVEVEYLGMRSNAFPFEKTTLVVRL